jgi:PAS domain S-box-containing protein
MGKSMLDLAAPEERARIQDDFHRAQPGRTLKNQEYTFCKMDGDQFPAEVNASMLLDVGGKPLGFVSAIRGISERKQAEALQSQLAAIVEHSDDAIISKTLDGRIVSWNRGAERMYGYTADEVSDQSITLLAPEERIPEVLQILERIKQGEPFIHLESEWLRKDGGHIDVSLTISPIKDAAGEVTGASTIARDITERKKMEAYMLRTERLAAMGHIAAVLAHEVKNLLQAVQSNLDVVLEYPLDPDEREEYLVMCSQELDRLAMITNRVLNLASPKKSIYNMILVKDLLSRVLTLVAKPLQLAHIQIATDVPETLAAELDIPDQILEVLLNLIINSIEAMPEGGLIYITASADQEHIRLTLRNNGPAISAESLPHLFDPFFTTKPEGTGLGLSISHSIIQNYGGRITAENLPDEIGIEFVIELPRLKFEIAEDPVHG